MQTTITRRWDGNLVKHSESCLCRIRRAEDQRVLRPPVFQLSSARANRRDEDAKNKVWTARNFRHRRAWEFLAPSKFTLRAELVMKTKFPPPAPRELVVIVDPKAGIRVRNGQVISIVEAYQADAE